MTFFDWIKELTPPFVEMVHSIATTGGGTHGKLGAVVAFQRHVSDEIMRHELESQPTEPAGPSEPPRMEE